MSDVALSNCRREKILIFKSGEKYTLKKHRRQIERHSTHFFSLKNGIKNYHGIFSHKVTIFTGKQDEVFSP